MTTSIPTRNMRLSMLLVGSLVASCANFSDDGGVGAVRDTVRTTLGRDIQAPRTQPELDAATDRVAKLLALPVSADAAVEIAILNNRGLRATYAQLGLAEADLVQVGRLPNPRFSMLRAQRDGEFKIEQAITMNVFALITMPLASQVERRRFEAAQRQVAIDTLRLAAEVRKAHIQAVAGVESQRYMRQVQTAAQAGAELARRMTQVGNWSRLRQAREQMFHADAALALARAEQASLAQRERLIRLLGLWGDQVEFKLPERLADLPKEVTELPDIEARAMHERLDLQAMRLDADALARNLGLTKTTRFINVLEFGPARVLEGHRNDPYKRGYEIAFELPIFDWGSARVAKAEAIYMQAVERTAQAAIDARSEVREAYRAVRSTYDIARHYRDEVVPLKKRIADENVLRYNGMIVGVFDLLADSRAQTASVAAYLDALRDYWLADADLSMARIGRPTLSGVTASLTAPVIAPGGH